MIQIRGHFNRCKEKVARGVRGGGGGGVRQPPIHDVRPGDDSNSSAKNLKNGGGWGGRSPPHDVRRSDDSNRGTIAGPPPPQ